MSLCPRGLRRAVHAAAAHDGYGTHTAELDSVIVTSGGPYGACPETDAVFVVGLLEGEFPQTPGDQGF